MKGKSRRRSAQRAEREQRILDKIHLNAAGIDIGSESHWVAVPDDRDELSDVNYFFLRTTIISSCS